MRVRWTGIWKVAAAAVALLLALQALPALLRPPEPPPLAPDVGLPRVVPAPEEPPALELRFPRHHRSAKRTTGSAASDVIGSRPRPKRRHLRPRTVKSPPAPPQPAAAPPAVEPAPYEPPPPTPASAPPPPPASPSDGSEEFAPR